MHLLCSLIVAFMALFPGSAGEGGLNLRAWMESYEKYLYQQMYDNFEREKAETVTFKPKNAVSQQNMEMKDEQAPVEEVQEEPSDAGAGGDLVQHTAEETFEDVESVETTVQNSEDTPMAAEAEMAERNGQTPLYSVNGAILSEEIQVFLFQKLSEQNIAYFMPYAMMIMYQESKLDIYAENPNGRDKGLLQYRVEYVPWMDWRNPYQQIEYFVAQMANRAAAGCTVSEMISRHNMSDYGSYNQSYVDAVMQLETTLVRVR